jgi:hypothetical protein
VRCEAPLYIKPNDVTRAVHVIASDARQRQRYGTLVEKLPSVWLNLLRSECIKAVVMEDMPLVLAS